MAKRKTEFELTNPFKPGVVGVVKIQSGEDIETQIHFFPSEMRVGCLYDKDLETFALNILKALGSKHLKK